MQLHQFYRMFEDMNKSDRFEMIESQSKPTSMFVIFQQLTHVRAQKKYFEEQEAHLLDLAEKGFKKIMDKKNGQSEGT